MKTLNVLHQLTLRSLLCILGFITGLDNMMVAQDTYLKIVPTNNDWIAYPPGTKFELKDRQNRVVMTDESEESVFQIDDAYTLSVYPTYKSEMDEYQLSEGSIQMVKSEKNYPAFKTNHKYGFQSNGLTLTSTLTQSRLNPSEQNVVMEFSNGVTFTYQDGKVEAKKNGTLLMIKGQYLIQLPEGLIKVSYNPKNGEIWWVYQLSEKEKREGQH